MAEDLVLPIPNLKLPDLVYQLSNPSLSRYHDDARKKLLEGIEADRMVPYYKLLASSGAGISMESTLLDKLEEQNKEELESYDKRLEEAMKTEGETEISDILRAKAACLTRIGDKERAVEAQKVALEKTPGLGSKIDITLTLARIGFFFSDNALITSNLTHADTLIEKGGDWDRRNRLKVYNALHAASIRQFKKAGELFSDALSTFTASELVDYDDFVALSVITNTVALSRVDLKAKIVQSPEINAVLPNRKTLASFIKSFYGCHYDQFFVALAQVEQEYFLPSRLLAPHTRWYIREMKVLAYAQLLESYRSLTLESLSQAFGLSVGFVDNELSRFIATSRIHATIDKVHGIVETNRPEAKNAQYETVVKQGDILLNKIQRLSKVLY